MAKIPEGIFGPVIGKIGPIIGQRWKNISVIRSIPQHINDPKTPAQLRQRAKFAAVQHILSQVKSFVNITFKQLSERQTEQNAFMSVNLKNAFTNGQIDYANLQLSAGNLPACNDAQAHLANNTAVFTWKTAKRRQRRLDKAMPLVFNITKDIAVFDTKHFTRKNQSATLNLPADWANDKIMLYLCFTTPDGKKSSRTLFLGNRNDNQQTISQQSTPADKPEDPRKTAVTLNTRKHIAPRLFVRRDHAAVMPLRRAVVRRRSSVVPPCSPKKISASFSIVPHFGIMQSYLCRRNKGNNSLVKRQNHTIMNEILEQSKMQASTIEQAQMQKQKQTIENAVNIAAIGAQATIGIAAALKKKISPTTLLVGVGVTCLAGALMSLDDLDFEDLKTTH